MANVKITLKTVAKYDDHHVHTYAVGDIHQIGSFLMPAWLSTFAVAKGWAVSDVGPPTPADDDPSEEMQHRQVGSLQKPVVSKDGS